MLALAVGVYRRVLRLDEMDGGIKRIRWMAMPHAPEWRSKILGKKGNFRAPPDHEAG